MGDIPSILSVMTPFPIHTSPDTSLIAAQSLMKGHDVRHLPITEGDRVLGVVSAAELRIAEALTGSHDLPVGKLCTHPPLLVETHDPVRQVLGRMSEEGVSAALVLRHGRLAGIVTLSEVCDALLRRPPAPSGGGEGPEAA